MTYHVKTMPWHINISIYRGSITCNRFPMWEYFGVAEMWKRFHVGFHCYSVASNRAVLRGRVQTSKTLSLPEFLGLLQQQGIAVGDHKALVEQCIKIYSLARYEDGVSHHICDSYLFIALGVSLFWLLVESQVSSLLRLGILPFSGTLFWPHEVTIDTSNLTSRFQNMD